MHPENAASPIVVRLLGRVRLPVKPLHPENALVPILVTLAGSATLSSFEHSLKALAPTPPTFVPIVTSSSVSCADAKYVDMKLSAVARRVVLRASEVTPVQPAKASLSIVGAPVPRVTFSK
jgi:hypothetical protein